MYFVDFCDRNSCMPCFRIGKSYSLNHLVDTSFAGSALRTTEVSALSIV